MLRCNKILFLDDLNTNEMMTNDVTALKDRCLLPKSEGSNKGPLKKATLWYVTLFEIEPIQ